MPELLWLNGEVMPLGEGRVSVEDRGFQFADGVYDVAVVYAGVPYELSEHIDRLFVSAGLLEINIPHPAAEMETIARQLVGDSRLGDGLIYIQVTRGYAPRKHGFPPDAEPTVVVYVRDFEGYPPENYEKGVRTITVPDERWDRCNIKSIALLPNCLAKERAHRAKCYEAIFCSARGVVREGSSSNVFCVVDGTVTTAPLSNKILPGITRARVLVVARGAGLPVVEREYTVEELKNAGEVFLTGTTTEVMPVVMVDDTTIGAGAPGPVTRQLRQLMLEHIAECCAGSAVRPSGKG